MNLENLEKTVPMLVIVGMLMIAFFVLMYYYQLRREVNGTRVYYKEKVSWNNLIWVLGAAFIIKLIIAAAYEGHGTDMSCFSAWSDMIFSDGPWGFYHSDAFTDYPPGYMALLWIVGALRKGFSLDVATGTGRIVIKLFPILFDLGAGILVYQMAKKKFSEVSSLLLSVTYVLNPIIVLDSSAWGQVDGVFTFFVLLVAYYCMEEKRIPAYFAFVAGVLIKPQMLMFAPILIWTIIQQVFLQDFNAKKMVRDLIGGLSAIAAMILFTLPFGIDKVFGQYVNTLGSYPYCTINAYNFWALMGQNWLPQTNTFLGIQASMWGTLAILVSVALSGLVYFKLKEDKSRYFLSMAVLIANMFLFSVRMHERYLFPIIILLLAAFLVKPTKELFFTYVGFSVLHFLNVGHVLWAFIEENQNTAPRGSLVGIVSLLTLVMFTYLFVAIFSRSSMGELEERKGAKKRGAVNYIQKNQEVKEKKKWSEYVLHIHSSKKMPGFTKWDWIVLFVILVLYSAFAFYDLGDRKAPETNWCATQENKSIMLDLGDNKDIGMIYTYLGVKENRTFTLEASQDGQTYENKGTVRASSVFCWDMMKTWKEDSQEEGPDRYEWDKDYRYIRLTATNDLANETVMLNEIVVTDKDGNVINPVNQSDYPMLFDEQQCFEPQEDAPKTEWLASGEGTTVTIDLGSDQYFALLRGYSKKKAGQKFKIETAKSSDDKITYTSMGELITGDADGWSILRQTSTADNVDNYTFSNEPYRYIRITTLQKDTSLNELVVTNSENHVVKIIDSEGGDSLFDEQDGYNKAITFRSGTYFDEIYHAKTAYEMIHGISNYEWTHPPLGKWFISLGIRAFGMNPFGWRVIGVLFGIAMLPFMYLFARRLFGARTWAAGGLTFLFAFDFMHFTQTRISTIDVYGTFFIIAMFFFMYWYSQTSFYDTKLWKTFIPLGLSAIMMGMGCASKWTAVYASAGLGVFFAAIMVWRFYEYRLAKKNPSGSTEGISHQHIIEVFPRKLIATLLFCILFFVILAGTIYLCAYIPFDDFASVGGGGNTVRFGQDWDNGPLAGFVQMLRDNTGKPFYELVGKMLNNQKAMYTYHHDLDATHPFSSAWYEWPTMIRPMYYYCQTLSNGLKEGISAFGNPLVWWAGIPAFLFVTCPFSAKRKLCSKLGSIQTQWVQWAGCVTAIFLALYSLVLRQTKYTDIADTEVFSQWGWYGVPFILLGIAGFGFLCIQLISRGERVAAFMIFAFAVQYLPWVLVPRCTFAYHFFPSVPFIAMMIVYSMVKITEYNKKWLRWCLVYLAAAFLLFLLFYPVLSGQPVIEGLVRDGLRWMKGWQLVS